MGRRNYSFDANMALADGAAAITAAGFAQFGGATGIIDLGGNQGITVALPAIADVTPMTPQQARFDGVVVIYVTSMTVAASVYKLALVGSNNPAMTSGNVILGMLELGGAIVDIPGAAANPTPLGTGFYPAGEQFELLFTNEQYGSVYEFVALYVSGTFGALGITLRAFIGVLPRI